MGLRLRLHHFQSDWWLHQCPVQITLAVMISGWAHVLHALYKPWGTATRTYKLQHLSLFTTTFIFVMGLLFKVNGVSQEGSGFATMTVIMLTLCVAFAVLWVAAMLSGIVNTMRVKHLPRMASKLSSLRLSRSRLQLELSVKTEPTLLVTASSGYQPSASEKGLSSAQTTVRAGQVKGSRGAGEQAEDSSGALRKVLVVRDDKESAGEPGAPTLFANPMHAVRTTGDASGKVTSPPGTAITSAGAGTGIASKEVSLFAPYAPSSRRDCGGVSGRPEAPMDQSVDGGDDGLGGSGSAILPASPLPSSAIRASRVSRFAKRSNSVTSFKVAGNQMALARLRQFTHVGDAVSARQSTE